MPARFHLTRQRSMVVLGYLGAAAASVVILGLLLPAGHLQRDVLFTYVGETFFTTLLVQGPLETGGPGPNDRLGAPFALDMRDFPLADSLHHCMTFVLSWVVDDPVGVLNVYFLVTFPLVTLTSLAVFRHFGCSYGPAVVASLLFAFLPYHFLRYSHLFYTGYFLVPPMVMVLLWLWREPRGWPRSRLAAGLLICALVGCAGIYYACFGCFYLVLVGAIQAWQGRSWAALRLPLALSGVIVLTGVASLTPHFLARLEHGPNPDAVIRGVEGGELYGLKIAPLLLPATDHRVPLFAKIKDVYNRHTLHLNENDCATLGMAGSVAFLALLAVFLVRRRERPTASLLEPLSAFTWSALLLAGGSGFAGVLTFISPQVRAYNRISIYVGFFAFFALALGLTRLQEKLRSLKAGRIGNLILLGLLLVVGLLDETPAFVGHLQDSVLDEWRHDAAYIAQIETALPARAMVFQLPFASFPESPPVEQMRDYDHLRAYVHSKTLRWSYPSMRGRPGHVWQKNVAAKRPEDMVGALVLVGFQGLYVDRFGYKDRAAELEAELQRLLQSSPLVSPNGRLAFYDLRDRAARMRRGYSGPAWEQLRARALDPPEHLASPHAAAR